MLQEKCWLTMLWWITSFNSASVYMCIRWQFSFLMSTSRCFFTRQDNYSTNLALLKKRIDRKKKLHFETDLFFFFVQMTQTSMNWQKELTECYKPEQAFLWRWFIFFFSDIVQYVAVDVWYLTRWVRIWFRHCYRQKVSSTIGLQENISKWN